MKPLLNVFHSSFVLGPKPRVVEEVPDGRKCGSSLPIHSILSLSRGTDNANKRVALMGREHQSRCDSLHFGFRCASPLLPRKNPYSLHTWGYSNVETPCAEIIVISYVYRRVPDSKQAITIMDKEIDDNRTRALLNIDLLPTDLFATAISSCFQ